MITEIHDQETFDTDITHHAGYSLVDFWTTWCGPCRMMAPVLEAADSVLGDRIAFHKVDVDEMQELAGDLDIMSIPTIILFKDGEEVNRFIGAMSQEEFIQQVENSLD